MSAKELTYQDIAEHNTKNDVYLVIHDKVYDASKFIDEHPGGEEVMMDVAGLDATEAFEDVGHSDEARETLEQLYVCDLKRQAGDPKPQTSTANTSTTQTKPTQAGMGFGVYLVIVLSIAAYYGYQYMQNVKAAPSSA